MAIWVQPPKPIVIKLSAIVQVNGDNLMYSLAKLTCSRFRERPWLYKQGTHCLTYDKWGGFPYKHTHTHTSLCMCEHIMTYTHSEFVFHHHSMCLKMFGLEYLKEYISTTIGQRAPHQYLLPILFLRKMVYWYVI